MGVCLGCRARGFLGTRCFGRLGSPSRCSRPRQRRLGGLARLHFARRRFLGGREGQRESLCLGPSCGLDPPGSLDGTLGLGTPLGLGTLFGLCGFRCRLCRLARLHLARRRCLGGRQGLRESLRLGQLCGLGLPGSLGVALGLGTLLGFR